MSAAGNAVGLVIAVLFVADARAAAPAGQVTSRAVPNAGFATLADNGAMSRDRIIDAIQKRFNARVVRVTELQMNGRPALELRLLSEQRVWNIVVDADTGQVLAGG
jgi:uncharacterized membrane protein YkoI